MQGTVNIVCLWEAKLLCIWHESNLNLKINHHLYCVKYTGDYTVHNSVAIFLTLFLQWEEGPVELKDSLDDLSNFVYPFYKFVQHKSCRFTQCRRGKNNTCGILLAFLRLMIQQKPQAAHFMNLKVKLQFKILYVLCTVLYHQVKIQ